MGDQDKALLQPVPFLIDFIDRQNYSSMHGKQRHNEKNLFKYVILCFLLIKTSNLPKSCDL